MLIIRAAFGIALTSIISSATVAQPAGCTASTDIVCTDQGQIRGVIEGETLAFKGIPYAQPPVGSLRWKAPLPASRWEGVRDGTRYAPMCPQIVGKEVKGEEDCPLP
jgi:para-nitrobenzyl esterase